MHAATPDPIPTTITSRGWPTATPTATATATPTSSDDKCGAKLCPAASGACKVGGVCNAADGTCRAETDAADGTSCDDQDAATAGDVCTEGVCKGTDTGAESDSPTDASAQGSTGTTDDAPTAAEVDLSTASGNDQGSSGGTDDQTAPTAADSQPLSRAPQALSALACGLLPACALFALLG